MFCRFNLHFWGEISVDKSSYRFNLHSWWDEISIVFKKKRVCQKLTWGFNFWLLQKRSMIFPWNMSHFFEISMVCFLQKISPGHRRRRSPIRPRSRPCWSHGWSLMTKKPMKKGEVSIVFCKFTRGSYWMIHTYIHIYWVYNDMM